MPIEKIANPQLFFIHFMMRTTIVVAFLPVLTSADAAQDAWVAVLITFVGTELLVLTISALAARFPQQTAIQYSQKLLGPFLGKLVSSIYLWAFLHMASCDVRIYGEAIVNGFLPETPLAFIIGGMVLAATVAACAGVEVIGRLADLLFLGFLSMLLFSLITPLPLLNLALLEPVLARGLRPVLEASLVPVAVGAQALFLTILTPHLDQPRLVVRTAFWAVAASSLVLLLTALLVVGVLGPDIGSHSIYPFFRMIRAIEVSVFLGRVEGPIRFAWGFGLFIGIATFVYSGAKGLSQWLGLSDYRGIIWPMAAICVVLSIHSFEDIFLLETYMSPPYVGSHALAFTLIPQGILWAFYGFTLLKTSKKAADK